MVAGGGVGVAVAHVQVGVPDLVDAGDQRAAAHMVVQLRAVDVVGPGFEAVLLQPLAGVAQGVDVGDVVARHAKAVLGGVDAQAGGGEGVEGSHRRHSGNSL